MVDLPPPILPDKVRRYYESLGNVVRYAEYVEVRGANPAHWFVHIQGNEDMPDIWIRDGADGDWSPT